MSDKAQIYVREELGLANVRKLRKVDARARPSNYLMHVWGIFPPPDNKKFNVSAVGVNLKKKKVVRVGKDGGGNVCFQILNSYSSGGFRNNIYLYVSIYFVPFKVIPIGRDTLMPSIFPLIKSSRERNFLCSLTSLE